MRADFAISPTPRRSSFCAASERLKFNYNEVTKGKKMEQNILVKPGDQIIVP